MILVLYGNLRETYGERIELAARTFQDLMIGVIHTYPKFLRDWKNEAEYHKIILQDKDGQYTIQKEDIDVVLPKDTEFHFVPVVEGEELTFWISVIVTIITTIISMALTILLAPGPVQVEAAGGYMKKQSFLFLNSINVDEQGGAIPVIYGGPLLVGSTVSSTGYDVEEIQG